MAKGFIFEELNSFYSTSVSIEITQHLLRKTPVVVTGMGVHSAAGTTVDEFWKSILAGESLAAIEDFDGANFISCRAPDPGTAVESFPAIRKMSRVAKMACVAASQAWESSGLAEFDHHPNRGSIIVGTSRGSLFEYYNGSRKVLPSSAANSSGAAIAGILSRMFRIEGASFTVNNTCSSGSHSMVLAAQQILTGAADFVLVGGVEAPLFKELMSEMSMAGVLATSEDPANACRPFSFTRNGTVLGEGAAFLLLESEHSAIRRGAKYYAKLSGWALSTDNSQRTGISEDMEVMSHTLRTAIEMAGLDARDIGYVHAHGTGTKLNDYREAKVLQRTFAHGVPCSSTKPVTGHCLGAAGALGALVAIMAMRDGLLPPSSNCLPIDPDIDLELIHKLPREAKIGAVMANAAGFWGNTSSLLFTS